MVSFFTTVTLGARGEVAIFDCGTPWRSFQVFLPTAEQKPYTISATIETAISATVLFYTRDAFIIHDSGVLFWIALYK